MFGQLKTITRKRGSLTRLFVEIDVSQAREFETTIRQLGMTKADAISAALSIWLNMVKPKR